MFRIQEECTWELTCLRLLSMQCLLTRPPSCTLLLTCMPLKQVNPALHQPKSSKLTKPKALVLDKMLLKSCVPNLLHEVSGSLETEEW